MTATNPVYRYQPNEDGAPNCIGWCPGFLNRYGMVMVPARLVPADHKEHADVDQRPGVSDKPKHVFEAGKPFQVVEDSELHQFVRTSQLFRRVLQNELRVDGGGRVISIEIDKPVQVERDGPHGVDPGDEQAIFGASSNSSWSALEEVSSAKLMRHASHGGKRAGNER
jgi:hypothetical protein